MASARALDRVSVLLVLTDVVAILLACALVQVSILSALLLIVVVLVAFQGNTLYRSRLTLSVIDELPVLVAGIAAAVGVTALVTFSTSDVEAWQILLQGAVVLTALLLGRTLAYAFVRTIRRKGWVAYRTLIVGTGPTAARVARTLEEHPEHGLRVVGFMGPQLDSASSVQEGILEEDPVELAAVTVEHDVAVVIITYVGMGSTNVLKALRMRDPQTRYTLFLVPPLFQMLHSPRRERIRDVALIRLRPALWQLVPWRLKRLMDLAFSFVALALLSPIMALTALAVRWEMGPDVLFRQTRVGSRGRPFTLLKFRSLKPENANESATNWSVSNDSRIGPVGRFIRKTSLDELPQLINILRGDMSLVGPRPERPYFVEKFNRQYDSYPLRHRVRPGLTGWAAVNGLRGNTSIEERAYFDNVYIDNWSLWLDVKIMARTVTAVFGGQGS